MSSRYSDRDQIKSDRHRTRDRTKDDSPPDTHRRKQHIQKRHHNDHHTAGSHPQSLSPEARQASRQRPMKREHDDDDRRPVKRERHDPGYDRAHRASRNSDAQERRHHNKRREDHAHQRGDQQSWAADVKEEDEEEPVDKEKPNFALSGKLTEETNTYKGVVIKYNQPPEARKPKKRWRFYPFKNDEVLPILHLHRQSAYLMGRDRKIADIPVDHPSCSKQHAVLQYRLVDFTREDGTKGRRVKPYIIDLDSANGTYVNNKRVDPSCYVELFEKDVVKFGYSSREYVLLHDKVDVSEVDQGASDQD